MVEFAAGFASGVIFLGLCSGIYVAVMLVSGLLKSRKQR